jgi:(E)-4-hydroxy-3-methylbut-2-enyl-diphosphate synthase
MESLLSDCGETITPRGDGRQTEGRRRMPPVTAPLPPYCADPFGYRRRPTRAVRVGSVVVGGGAPISVQSMTTAAPDDVEGNVAQVLALAEAGCDIVRLTTPTVRDAECLGRVRDALRARGCSVPLVADIHFNPEAALRAADFADKVRVNPGNYADGRKFAVREYTDAEYAAELRRVEERFAPLLEKCARLGRSIRIGVNHGSLSDRITNRFGDSPAGMVESALEFLRIAERRGFRDVILSMKASNVRVMIAAYRLLAARMAAEGLDHPFHLGVTEAGGGLDGRVKSAIGIGSLLADGIGDTVRVSLTEDPVHEVPVARALVASTAGDRVHGGTAALAREGVPAGFPEARDPFDPRRRATEAVAWQGTRLGGSEPVRVGVIPRGREPEEPLPAGDPPVEFRGGAHPTDFPGARSLPAGATDREIRAAAASGLPVVVWPRWRPGDGTTAVVAERMIATVAALRAAGAAGVIVEAPVAGAGRTVARALAAALDHAGLPAPILLTGDHAAGILDNARDLGGLLVDGIGDAVALEAPPEEAREAADLAYAILQASRVRMTRPDYIACPGCGRTLFDLESTTDRIRGRTGHLAGLKIAVMGCIVNGPGEMADADFGYVGSAPGRVSLYVGKECVERNIPSAEADDRLVALIRAKGLWSEPPDSGNPAAAGTLRG